MRAAWTNCSILKAFSCSPCVADIVNAAVGVDICNLLPLTPLRLIRFMTVSILEIVISCESSPTLKMFFRFLMTVGK